jgi:hypothetical protein
MKFKSIVIFGASSAIAQEVARQATSTETHFILVGRDEHKLSVVASDLKSRGAAAIRVVSGDLINFSEIKALVDVLWNDLDYIDFVLIAHGSLPDQVRCETDMDYACSQLEINFISSALIAQLAANRLKLQGSGTLAVISSVAGDRGRQSLYLYGAAKAGLSTFLEGLRHRMYGTGVKVLTIKPGLVDTPMTAHLKKGPLVSSPKVIAHDILKAMVSSKDVVYSPWFWQWIMLIIRSIPRCLFYKTKL